MRNYLELLKKIQEEGITAEYRNGNRLIISGESLSFDFAQGFPLMTTKTINYKTAFAETLMFIKGITNTQYLKDLEEQGVRNIWKQWELDEDTGELKTGYIGPMYGYLWRNYPLPDSSGEGSIDQLKTVIENIKTKPNSSRHFVTAYHPGLAADDSKSIKDNILDGKGCLNPCHHSFQFIVRDTPHHEYGTLDLVFNMSSSDVPVGLPYNIAGYGLLLALVAYECNLVMGKLTWHGGNVQIYENQLPFVKTQLARIPYSLPTLTVNNFTSIWDVELEDIKVHNYNAQSHIPYPVS